jgi:hypothetical protein
MISTFIIHEQQDDLKHSILLTGFVISYYYILLKCNSLLSLLKLFETEVLLLNDTS